jgi:hypothetical protein
MERDQTIAQDYMSRRLFHKHEVQTDLIDLLNWTSLL